MWTKFYDLYSGGYAKTKYNEIYIELPMEEAIKYFKELFDVNPNDVSCNCCGSDFAIREVDESVVPNGSNGIFVAYVSSKHPKHITFTAASELLLDGGKIIFTAENNRNPEQPGFEFQITDFDTLCSEYRKLRIDYFNIQLYAI